MEKEKSEDQRGGSVILVDEELNTVSLRMYNESEEEDQYKVIVEKDKGLSSPPDPFHKQISDLVNQYPDPWKKFSTCAAKEVKARGKNVAKYIEMEI